MAIKKYLDWKGWFLGAYLAWVKTITNSVLAMAVSNGAEKAGLAGVGMNWKQFLCFLGWLSLIEAVKYLNAKPKPETVTETTETQIINKP